MKPAAFYERPTSRYEARYVPLYEAAAALIPPGARVVELGCGNGRFARYVTGPYIGLDFAPGQVAEAIRYNGGGDFRVADLMADDIPDADAYVALEVLEHLDDDLGLLRRLPRGATVVLSVPSFDSAAHVRHFPVPGSAAARYSRVLELDHASTIPLPRAYFHLLRGRT